MQNNLQAAEDQLKDAEENYEQEKKEMQNKIVEKSSEENKLMARIESITAENDFTKEQLSALKAKYENIKNGEISGLLKPIKDTAGNVCLCILYVCALLTCLFLLGIILMTFFLDSLHFGSLVMLIIVILSFRPGYVEHRALRHEACPGGHTEGDPHPQGSPPNCSR